MSTIEEHNARKYTGKAAKAKIEVATEENIEAEKKAEEALVESAFIANVSGTSYDLQMLPYPRARLLLQYRDKVYRPGLSKILKLQEFYRDKDTFEVPEEMIESTPIQIDLFRGLVEALLKDNHPEWPQIMDKLNHGDVQDTAIKILGALEETKGNCVSFLLPKK